jgi:3-deoxy-D-manno-octulosonic-acid transferase
MREDVPRHYCGLTNHSSPAGPTCVPAQESPFYPSLVLMAVHCGVRLALLNARIGAQDLYSWSAWGMYRTLLREVLHSFSLIVPQSDKVPAGGSDWS